MNTSKITITFDRDTNHHQFDVQGCSGTELIIAAETIKDFIVEKSGMSYDATIAMAALRQICECTEEEEEPQEEEKA